MVHFDWAALSDEEFEELCKELMRRKGFTNVVRMGAPGSGDRGRDIMAEENLSSQTGRTIHTKILVQCKNYAGSRTTIGPSDIESWAHRAKTLRCDRLLVITSHDLSAQAKITAKEISENPSWGVYVEWWNQYDLFSNPMTCPDLKRLYSVSPFVPSVLNVGIFNGFVRNPTTENRCDYAFTRVTPDRWKNLLQKENTSISLIKTSEIASDFDVIINPFGEIYPEEDPSVRKTYRDILEYVEKGGLYINTGGFPFFYYWNPIKGTRVVATDPTIRFRNIQTGQSQGLFTFKDTPFSRDFNVFLDPRGVREVDISQQDEDRNYVGDLLEVGYQQVNQFRSVINSNLEHVIPLLRAEDNRIFPLVAVQYGFGYVLVAGFDQYEREAIITAEATYNWLCSAGGQLSL